jgi:hypothetical protein
MTRKEALQKGYAALTAATMLFLVSTKKAAAVPQLHQRIGSFIFN